MGTCHEFGPSIHDGCDAPMQATRGDACTCPECGVVCHGRFPGCATVWARGPQSVHWREFADAHAAPEPAASDLAAPAPGSPGIEAVVADLQRLVAEVARLREDFEDHRIRTVELAGSLASEARAEIAAEFDRLFQNDGHSNGVLRRLAAMVQPSAGIDVDALAARLKAELVPAVTARVLAEQQPPTPPWQDRTA